MNDQPLDEAEEQHLDEPNILMGISDIIFEVMYGASQDLHSKAQEILDDLLGLVGDKENSD